MSRTRRRPAAAGAIPAATAPDIVSDAGVLLADVDGHRRGLVVRGERVGELITAGQARPATDTDLAVAGVNIRILD
jgi:hypothetical protein